MNDNGLLPGAGLLRLDHIIAQTSSIVVLAATAPHAACCPVCHQQAVRVHSHYQRTLSDVPWHGVSVRLRLQARRFFCDNANCSRAIFTEPLPGVAERYARRTLRLQEAFQLIGLIVGGEAGARLAQELGMCSSPDTLLRLLRRATISDRSTPRVLGVDDWAFRKGQHYGTILCDLEQRRVVDLLPDRQAATLAAWLKEHPGVEIITRDRSPLYAEGAATGAPEAVQVADRWHLLKNLRETMERLLSRHHKSLKAAAQTVVQQLATSGLATSAVERAGAQDEEPQLATGPPSTGPKRLSQHRRENRHDRYQEVMALYEQGVAIRTIAHQLGMGRHTVRRFIRAGALPERQSPRTRPSQLDPYKAYLRIRWEAGCHNAAQLWQEIRDQGFAGSKRLVRQYVESFRAHLPTHLRRRWRGAPQDLPPKVHTPSSRSASWLLLYPETALQHAQRRGGESLVEQQRLLREQLCGIAPEVHTATQLAQEFIGLLETRQPELLAPWLEQCMQKHNP